MYNKDGRKHLTCSYDIIEEQAATSNADNNNDGIITAKEVQDITDHNIDFSTPCYYSQYYFETIMTTNYILGDVNQDNAISMQDVLLLRNYIAGNTTLSFRQNQLADLNGDGSVSLMDVNYMQKYIAGLPL